MSTLGIRTDASGTFGALTLGGVDKVTVGNDGIQAGSFAPNSITATELAAGALIETSPVGIGYGPGAGGTVTQSTSKSTAVTLNKPCGQITMNAASLAAGAVVGFVMNNSLLQEGDTIVPSIVADGVVDPSTYNVWAAVSSGGANAKIYLRNVSAGALSQAIIIDFKIIKGATA